jgi:S-adenosyl-L-methionine hydrolase (adenosine-forming)
VPILTLTSDIGYKDYITGAIKGRLWQNNPAWQIADISHNITPFNYNEAAYFVRSAYPHFPIYSWHIVLVNLFHSPSPRCLIAFQNGHFFACADNGLLPMILDEGPYECIVLPIDAAKIANSMAWMDAIGAAIQAVDNGTSLHLLGEEPEQIVTRSSVQPLLYDDYIESRIIFVDRFENVVVNVMKSDFDKVGRGRRFEISFKNDDRITKISEHYGSVPEGDKLAFFNTAGYLEIAVNKGNAAGLFGLQAFTANASDQFMNSRLFYQTVRIRFVD